MALELVAASPFVPAGNGTICLGDSLAYGGTYEVSSQLQLGMTSWFTWASHLSGGQIRYVRNAGVNSDTTAQALARIGSDVIAYDPDRCIVCIGTNDLAGINGGSKTFASVKTDYRSIVTALRGNRIDPILCLLPPRNTYLSEWDAFNEWLTRYAQSTGLKLVDLVTPLIDETTGEMQSAYTSDGVHFTQAGAKVAGQAIATSLAKYLPEDYPYITRRSADTANLITNGTFVGDGNADGIANSWSGAGSGGTVTRSLEADANCIGNWSKFDVSVAGQRNISQTISDTLWDVGDVLEFSGLATLTPVSGMTLTVQVVTTGGGTRSFAAFNQCSETVSAGTRFSFPFTVPSGATLLYIEVINSATGTGVFRVAQMTLRNLTTLGAA